MLAGIVLATCLAGCTSNPFMTNYVGVVQPLEGEPVRMTTKQGFDDSVVPVRDRPEGRDAAGRRTGPRGRPGGRSIGLLVDSRPKYHARTRGAAAADGRPGREQRHRRHRDRGTGLKWFAYEAVFYADRPKAESGGS